MVHGPRVIRPAKRFPPRQVREAAAWKLHGMKTFTLPLIVLAAAIALPASADNDKQLQNVKGSVSFQKPNKAAKPLATQATIVLADRDYTITGDQSLAALTLPDSSRVLIGSTTKVQMAFFNQAKTANAKFIIFNGRTRFQVQHPTGAKANYIFQTPTGSIAVRGTEGDIGVENGQLTVNVYEVSDPALPVQVSLTNGQTLTVPPGKSLVANYVNGQIQAQVQNLTDQMVNEFSPDFGLPTNWAQLKQTLINEAKSKLCPPFIPVC
jgi:FecR-like protein